MTAKAKNNLSMGAASYTEPKEQASSLLRLALSLPFAKTLVGGPGRQGVRFQFFKFFIIESYTCFQEPVLEPCSPFRIIFWKTKKQEQKPAGWRIWKGIAIGNTNAVSFVHKNFLQDWSANARRLALSLESSGVNSKQVSVGEFAKMYHASGYLDPFLRYGFLKIIRDHLAVHSDDVSIRFFYTKENNFLGGVVFVDYRDIKQSHYLISFLTDSGRKWGAGYAFIYWWYQHMLATGLSWADLGIVWQPGDPHSWRGYSQFKQRFHPQLITRTTYWKWA